MAARSGAEGPQGSRLESRSVVLQGPGQALWVGGADDPDPCLGHRELRRGGAEPDVAWWAGEGQGGTDQHNGPGSAVTRRNQMHNNN